MNNTLIQNGERNYATSLNARFADAVPTMVNFAFDSAALDENARAVLREQADFIRQFPEVRFRVYGHTDAVGPDAYNKGPRASPGAGRAQLPRQPGRPTGRGFRRSCPFGEERPLVVTGDRERRNRRTVTEVSGFDQRHPTVLDRQVCRDHLSRVRGLGHRAAAGPRRRASGDRGPGRRLTPQIIGNKRERAAFEPPFSLFQTVASKRIITIF